ncbi:hypothetical protein SBI_08997 [Streptomyces bingchenggensis BCW-1]|uniref:Transposase DDE domain-containing protein n=1 Tax=Streptomyces bingchenggensis (strain BCW-1) TaxID=749414 RepID=D7C075_STRBB|nr:hypothetical protein SBI_08997 [Streptomyces bingchenggensis BCW-1]
MTGTVDLDGYPAGTRIIVGRQRPHPGAQLSLFDQDEGRRHQAFLTDTPYSGGGCAQFLEVRHRGHATVEDRIRCGLLAWMRVLLLDGELATAEPKKLRYRLLHVAARLTRGGRRLRLRISATWPWSGHEGLNYAIYHYRHQRTPDGSRFTERVYEVSYLDTTPLAGSAPRGTDGD